MYFSPLPLNLKVKRLKPGATIPTYATDGSACFDLHVCGPGAAPCEMGGRIQSVTFSTGLAFEVPDGHVMLIFSRSGHGFKHGVRLANCVGVIDSDYRGEVSVRLSVDSEQSELEVSHGDRIAQAMALPVQQVTFMEVDELSSTARGAGGFGSTGK